MLLSKNVAFIGTALKDLKAFPAPVMQQAGFQLARLQNGELPRNWKPMPGVGLGVSEIRITDCLGAFRVIYVASRPEAIYVLHAFRKTSQKTEKPDIDLARSRLRQID